MMKKRALATGSILFLTGMGYTGAFAADSCSTCTSTSPIVEEYMNFSYEVIQTLQTIANEKQNASLQQTTSTNEGQRVLDRIVNNLNQKGQTALTFNVLIGTIGTQLIASDVRHEVSVMTNGKPLMRDRDRLIELDEDISDTLFDLGQAAAFIADIDTYKQRLVAIFTKYAQKNDAFIAQKGDPSSSAAVYIGALWDLNQAYKRFIAGGNTDGFDAFNRKYENTLGITLSRVNYEELSSQYACARGVNKCDKTYQNFGKNVSSVFNNAKKDSNEAIDTITSALTRLKCAFAKQSSVKCPDPGFKDKQNDLLRGLYGLAGPLANKEGTAAIANSMKGLGNSLKTQIDDVKDFYIKNDNQASEITPLSIGDLGPKVLPDASTDINRTDLYTSLLGTVNATLSESRERRQQNVLGDPLVVTRNLPRTSILVYNGINIIGTSQNAKTIVQNLGKACENQCSNLGGTCYY